MISINNFKIRRFDKLKKIKLPMKILRSAINTSWIILKIVCLCKQISTQVFVRYVSLPLGGRIVLKDLIINLAETDLFPDSAEDAINLSLA